MSILTVTPTEVLYEDREDEADFLPFLQEQCGGFVEAIDLEDDRVMWVHEYGKALDKPHNPRATAAMQTAGRAIPGDWVAGTAVITGRKGSETAPLTVDQLARTFRELAIH